MGYKLVCLDCQKAYSIGTDFTRFRDKVCPECCKMMVFVSEKFKPPKKTDNKQWKLVKYLIDNGFNFNRVVENGHYVPYPATLKEAENFVEKYENPSYLSAKK